jgi:hypothetical protein
VSLYEDIPAVAMHPVMANPMRARMRWTIPAARNPDIARAVPAVVAADPDKAGAGRWTASFDDRRGRPDTDHNLPIRDGRGERCSKQQSENEFLHGFLLLMGNSLLAADRPAGIGVLPL